jgi:uncharacterized alpha-E superfamily protein
MKQTAVQWLIHQLITENEVALKGENYKLFELAKEMEKQQIIDAYDAGLFDFIKGVFGSMDDVNDRIYKQYYNETYKSE